MRRHLAAGVLACALVASASPGAAQTPAAVTGGTVRTYYIAADEIDWNYVPGGRDRVMGGAAGMRSSGIAGLYVRKTPQTIGTVYRKAVYRAYTDGTFATRAVRPSADAYLGVLGPILYAQVGDTIRVVFANHGTRPYSIHPHGVFYDKASEGARYADGVPDAQKGGDAVAPGKRFTYTWTVPERAGPGPNDPSSIAWFYHSHMDERRDIESGLIGAIVVTRAGMAREDGTPKDVDRSIVALFIMLDENQSWFIDDDIRRFIRQPKKKLKYDGGAPIDPDGTFDPVFGSGFTSMNIRASINGFQFGTMPAPTVKRGERVRWYVMTIGEGFNFHTAHWHGNTVVVAGQRADVVALAPAQVVTADMVPDAPGTWLFHCHLSEHMQQGMAAYYRVLP